MLGGSDSLGPGLHSQGACSSNTDLVHRVDGQSNKSDLMIPSLGELEKLAQQARVIQPIPASVETGRLLTRSLRRRLPPQVIDELVARYTAGDTIRALSREYGVSRSGVCQLLQDEGVALREHGISPDDEEEAVRLYESGLTIRQVAERIGASHGTIQRVLNKHAGVMRASPVGKRPAPDGEASPA
jgi:transposase-like protein